MDCNNQVNFSAACPVKGFTGIIFATPPTALANDLTRLVLPEPDSPARYNQVSFV